MRLPPCIAIAATFLFAFHGLAHFSLTELQPISGFSDACTQAYETPLTDCKISDFYEGNICSPECVAFLQDMTRLLNDECRGTTAFPNTLIGMFFGKTAVQELCSGAEVTTASAGGADSSEPASAESTSPMSSFSSSISTSTIVQTATMTATSTASSTGSSLTSSIQSSVTTSPSPTSANSGQDSSDGSSNTSTLPETAPTPVSSPSGTQTGPTNSNQNSGGRNGGNNDGNGGTVLEAASTGSVKSIHGLLLITMWLALVLWSL